MASHRVPITTYDIDYTPKVIPNNTDTVHDTLNEGNNNKRTITMTTTMKSGDDDNRDVDKQSTELQKTLE